MPFNLLRDHTEEDRALQRSDGAAVMASMRRPRVVRLTADCPRLKEDQASSFHGENSRLVNSHNNRARTGNPHLLDGHARHARLPVGTQDDKGLVGTSY